MINITYGQDKGDCTCDYFIDTDAVTVRDFIDEWLIRNKGDWGYFGIKNPEKPSIFGEPCCEYRCGQIITEPLPNRLLNKKIKKVTGSGGYSRSDFLFEVEDFKRKRFKVWEL